MALESPRDPAAPHALSALEMKKTTPWAPSLKWTLLLELPSIVLPVNFPDRIVEVADQSVPFPRLQTARMKRR
jgi:hypothetical protein